MKKLLQGGSHLILQFSPSLEGEDRSGRGVGVEVDMLNHGLKIEFGLDECKVIERGKILFSINTYLSYFPHFVIAADVGVDGGTIDRLHPIFMHYNINIICSHNSCK